MAAAGLHDGLSGNTPWGLVSDLMPPLVGHELGGSERGPALHRSSSAPSIAACFGADSDTPPLSAPTAVRRGVSHASAAAHVIAFQPLQPAPAPATSGADAALGSDVRERSGADLADFSRKRPFAASVLDARAHGAILPSEAVAQHPSPCGSEPALQQAPPPQPCPPNKQTRRQAAAAAGRRSSQYRGVTRSARSRAAARSGRRCSCPPPRRDARCGSAHRAARCAERRHHLTGRFEAHLWDSTSERPPGSTKGRHRGKQARRPPRRRRAPRRRARCLVRSRLARNPHAGVPRRLRQRAGGCESPPCWLPPCPCLRLQSPAINPLRQTRTRRQARAFDRAAIKYWGVEAVLNFPLSDYAQEVNAIQAMSTTELIANLRRKSTGFSRGASKFRGVT